MGRQQQEEEQQSRVMYELCSLLLSILHSPSPSPSPPPPPSSSHPISYHPSRRSTELSPAGFASLLLGMSLALMLCGSVTFVIGFMLMPWVLGLVMVFYFVGLISSLSVLGRAILMGAASGPSVGSSGSTARKEMPVPNLGGSSVPNPHSHATKRPMIQVSSCPNCPFFRCEDSLDWNILNTSGSLCCFLSHVEPIYHYFLCTLKTRFSGLRIRNVEKSSCSGKRTYCLDLLLVDAFTIVLLLLVALYLCSYNLFMI